MERPSLYWEHSPGAEESGIPYGHLIKHPDALYSWAMSCNNVLPGLENFHAGTSALPFWQPNEIKSSLMNFNDEPHHLILKRLQWIRLAEGQGKERLTAVIKWTRNLRKEGYGRFVLEWK